MQVELRRLTKRFSEKIVLDSINATAATGEVIAVVGPNGAGKSVLLELLAGLETPSAGTIVVDGCDIRGDLMAYRDRLGYLPQKPGFHEQLSPRAWLMYLAELKAIPSHLQKQRVGELLAQLDIPGRQSIARLSTGIKQRLALATAFLNDPELVLLDEPLSALDTQMRLGAIEWLAARQAGRLTFLVSHILAGLEDYITRLWLLVDGRLEADVDVRELLRTTDGKMCLEDVYMALRNRPQK
ncbi:MAG TPA: ABC transporter ATP-binding protein [Firmicutes bacterium]|nr:ABC transporter ATP-binding protein [Bacillota bacterium]